MSYRPIPFHLKCSALVDVFGQFHAMTSVQGLKDKASVDARRAHDVLKHLDALKPVLQLDFNYVKLVYERLTKSKPAHILLNYYDVLVADVLKIFPNQATIMKNLIQIYQFHKPHAGLSIMVLDHDTQTSVRFVELVDLN